MGEVKPCSNGCGKPAHTRGWCTTCYQRWRRNGDPNRLTHPRRTPGQICTTQGCGRKARARKWCHRCYLRWLRHGSADCVMRPWEGQRQDIDDAAVERLCAGDRPDRFSVGDREAAVSALHALGMNDREIGDRLRVSARAVRAVRTRLGLPANQRGNARSGELYFTDHLAGARLKAIRAAKR